MTYDIHHFGLSGGKDSTALWGWAFNDSGYDPSTIRGSFCDTENEYQEVYDQIDKLDEYGQKRGAPPVVTLRSEGFLNLAIRKKRFPSAKARFCTQVLKMIPSRNYILGFTWLMGLSVLAHSGVRADESTERALLEEFGMDGFLEVPIHRPLLKNTVKDVWEMHKKYGLPINPIYFSGRRRVGCRLCCMSNKRDVRITANLHPEVIDEYREWERIVGKASGDGISTFFCASTTPERFRTDLGLKRKRDRAKGNKGDPYTICTIDDVVRWSKTLRGGKEEGFDFMYEMDDAYEGPCKSGYCE